MTMSWAARLARGLTPARVHRSSALANHRDARGSSRFRCASSDAAGPNVDGAHVKRYEVTASGAGGATAATVRGHTIRTDLPRKMGGADEHPQPVELLVAALIGCEQATAAFVARHMTPRLALAGLTFEYVARRDERGATSLPLHAPIPVPARLTGVTGVATVHLVRGAGPETAERVDELRRLTEERCPVASTLRAGGCELDVRWRLAGE